MPEREAGKKKPGKKRESLWEGFLILVIGLPAGALLIFGTFYLAGTVAFWLSDRGAGPAIEIIVVSGIMLTVIALLILALMWLARSSRKLFLDPDLKEFVPDDEEDAPPPKCREWAGKMGFEPVGVFRQTKTIFAIAVWLSSDRPTFFSCLFGGESPSFEFVTRFKNGVVLATGNSPWVVRSTTEDWALYAQTYARKSPEDLWKRHMEAEKYLVETGGAEFAERDVRFPDWFTEYRRKQIEALPRVPFKLIADKTHDRRYRHIPIRKQHERGMIRLPNEIRAERLSSA